MGLYSYCGYWRMKNKLLMLVALVALIVALPFIPQRETGPDSGYPWQIDLTEQGLSTVFGLTIGRTRMTEVRDIIGDGMKLALLSDDKGDAAVEMYYGVYTAGRLSGRLIIVADLAPEAIGGMRERAIRAGGANRFRIHNDDLPAIMQSPVKGITFIPLVDLDKDIILQRFGQPDEIVTSEDKLSHFLYAEKGLDVILDNDGKEVLQYVAPARFDQLKNPLGL